MNTYLSSLRKGLRKAMDDFPNTVLIGEDIVDPYGGAFKVTKGLSSKFPDRVISTPISESAIIGLSTGLAIRGYQPVTEIMFGDFLTLCADQIINSATKFFSMFNGKVRVPLLIRTPVGGIRGYGPTHSQSIEKIFFGIPGLIIISPSIVHNPGKIVYQIIKKKIPSPVLFLEDKSDYPKKLISKNHPILNIKSLNTNFLVPNLEITNYKHTNYDVDIILISYGGGASFSCEVLEELFEEEINIKMIVPALINDIICLKKIASYLKNEDMILIIEQGTSNFNWSSELASLIYSKSSIKTKLKISRLSAKNDIIPASKVKEKEILVTKTKIKAKIIEMIENKYNV